MAGRRFKLVLLPRGCVEELDPARVNLTNSLRASRAILIESSVSGPPSAAPRINNNHSAAAAASPGHKDARSQGHKDGGAGSASAAGSRYSAAGGTSAARPATASAVTKTSAAGMDSSRKYLFLESPTGSCTDGRGRTQVQYTVRRPVICKVLKIRNWGAPRPAWAVGSREKSPNPHVQNLANDGTPNSVY